MITEKLDEIVKKLCDCREDSEKTENGNVSAGRRVRKTSMEVIKDIKELRKLILENSKK
tara:strand:+ start:3587 stop:3763 length:177 start_codon:yes stop_codon:yes gene_type:complete